MAAAACDGAPNPASIARDEPLVGSDGCRKRHDRRRTRLFKAFAENRIGLDVGQDDESHRRQPFGGMERLDGIRKQVFRVGVDLQLDEVRAEGLAGQLRRQHGLLGIANPRGVGQQLDARTADVGQQVVLRVGHVDPFHGHGDHFGLRGGNGTRHQLVGAELARADEQTRTERPSADYQFVHSL